MTLIDNDTRLVLVMRRFFALRTEWRRARDAMEEDRKQAGQSVGDYYHARQGEERAAQIRRSVSLKAEMDFLMDLAASWADGAEIDLEGYAPEARTRQG